MKVYIVWFRESESDSLEGIYNNEADAIAKAEEVAEVFTRGNWSVPMKYSTPITDRIDNTKVLHSWGSKRDVEKNEVWETVSVEVGEVL